MRVVAAGLSSREEAAFSMFFRRVMMNWTWRSAPAAGGALPEADLLVVDLVAMGLGTWSEDAQLGLLRVLGGRPAVVLLSSTERSWTSMDACIANANGLVCLSKPYGMEDMRLALLKAASGIAQAKQKVLTPVNAMPVEVTSNVAPSTPHTPPLPKQPDLSMEEARGITAAELHTRLAAQPDVMFYVFLRKISVMLLLGQPFEVRFTIQHLLIIHPMNGWVISNTPMAVIERVCQSSALASAVSVKGIDTIEAEDWAQRLGVSPGELDGFLLRLVVVTLGEPTALDQTNIHRTR